ncbi:unnamed protein product [Dicrocoelium dendriticum]|nr:unnamed protein product [Dicrocoelium dendriticum]
MSYPFRSTESEEVRLNSGTLTQSGQCRDHVSFIEKKLCTQVARRRKCTAQHDCKGAVTTTHLRSCAADLFKRRLRWIQAAYHEDLVELSFIQSGSLLIDFPPWKLKKSQELIQALCSGHLDAEDLALIGGFMSGEVAADEFFPLGSAASSSQSVFDGESDEERGLDELSLHRLAIEELDVLKRVVELKQAGLWSVDEVTLESNDSGPAEPAPSLSSLAPPPEQTQRVYSDYLFAELRWLAEDYKRERQWKRVSAKKLALASIKVCREKTERSMKAEKEEVLRTRKLCAVITRMVRDFWRQIDKIVHAKQQVRLTAKRQQAITTHLGRVLETTEEYTRWLTQDMAGKCAVHPDPISKANDPPELNADGCVNRLNSLDKVSEVASEETGNRSTLSEERELSSSDSEYMNDNSAKSEAEDDEETIDREEREAASYTAEPLPSAETELAQLAADADAPIENLLPPGYFEYLMSQSVTECTTGSKTIVNTFESETNKAEDVKKQAMEITQPSISSTVPVPFLLTGGTLREYQLVGLNWLATIYQKRLNGILADEMGLGKTIQTIALLAHLACEHGVWGPHLIVVPTSVILNWEIEFKRWCPGFKIITYFGHVKERKERRKGWTKTNAFHVCITSYRLAIQDSPVFRRKKWKYLILDEAQNIKNFKSQRWQTLLTFNSQRRLLLTGTPLQNSLMELWSLMHFLMPNIFQSHRDFQEWFASPLTGMIEGNSEYNEQLVARLHKVLRPFLLRRLKADVERQMPKKFEHVIMCRLSRRQRFLYDDFMRLGSTKETLKSGHFLSVMNVLMQLRKVCNHPNLFETRPIISPFRVADYLLSSDLPALISSVSHPFLVLGPSANGGPSPISSASAYTEPDLSWLDRAGTAARLLGQTCNLAEMARDLPTFVAQRCRDLCARSNLITVIDTMDVVDDVSTKRKSVDTTRCIDKLDGVRNSFLSRNVIRTVQEERFGNFIIYPRLAQPVPVDPVIVAVSPPSRPCNTGMPKSILRNRTSERHKRLAVMARINERRCDIYDRVSRTPHLGPPDFESPLGPDLVHLVTRMTREPCASLGSRSVYLGLVNGWLACHRSLHWWPSRDDAYGRSPVQSRVEQAACLPVTRASFPESGSRLGPEASWATRWLWSQDCTALRMMLSHPADYLHDLDDLLKRFSFVVPLVISSGFTPHTSCPKYRSQLVGQSQRIYSLLASSCLPAVCLPSSGSDTPTSRGTRNTLPLSPLSWLMPVQLHRIATACRIQFPDSRLIQYDCGKLQRLDLLLRELKAGAHRALIFTQMTRMLDILEQFLAYHGHRYLRLDGATKVEQRQVLMERFNQDNQIFVFILSTRSGGLGVNLTGADTVIFYDSDWNPTMDAQAQDRCHRIGQTRDVHIYRLISERTVEENILRKANQKRFLSDVAIEGGRFTTAFFKQNTISELFAEPTGLQDLVQEKQKGDDQPISTDPISSIGLQGSGTPSFTTEDELSVTPSPSTVPSEETQFAALLEACEEDETDRIAIKQAMAEAKADLAEFDETIPLDDASRSGADGALFGPEVNSSGSDIIARFALSKRQHRGTSSVSAPTDGQPNESVHTVDAALTDLSPADETTECPVERELMEFEGTLLPIERFAVHQLEEQREAMLNEELVYADAQLTESNETWRLEQLKALHVADETRAEVEEDDMLYCYGTYDPSAQHLAELERLERIIAEEEAAADRSANAPRTRGRGDRFPRPTGGIKRGRGRGRGRGGHSQWRADIQADDTSTNETVLSEQVEHKRSAVRPRYAESSESDRDSDLERSHIPSQHLPTERDAQFRKNTQEWEIFVSYEDNGNDTETQKWSFSSRPSHSPPVSHTHRTSAHVPRGKRRGLPSRFLIPRKMPRVYCTSSRTHGEQIAQHAPVARRRGRPPKRLTSNPILGSFVRSNHFVTTPSVSPKRPLPTTFDRSSPESSKKRLDQRIAFSSRNTAVHQEAMRLSNPRSFTSVELSDSDESSVVQAGRGKTPGPLSARPNRFPPVKTAPAIRPVNEAPSFGHMTTFETRRINPTSVSNSLPNPVKVFTIKPITTPRASNPSNQSGFTIPSKSTPPRSTHPTTTTPTSRPSEPVIPVQSVGTGIRTSLPAGQLFTATGQPVFVITREMKTPTGEVYQQRFTHPVVPPPQFTNAVHRLARPTGAVQSPLVSVANINSPGWSTIRVSPVPPSPRFPVIRLASPTKTVQLVPSIQTNTPVRATPRTVASSPIFMVPYNSAGQAGTNIPVIRTIPTIRLVTSDSTATQGAACIPNGITVTSHPTHIQLVNISNVTTNPRAPT